MYFVINYKEYCEAIGEQFDGTTPSWFYRIQKQAIETIRKEIVDVKIFPINNAMLHCLKKQWMPSVIEGIAKQIFYTYNNEYFLNNGVFANRSYSQTQYGEGPVTREDYLNAINMACTPCVNAFIDTGWFCKNMNIKFDKDKYYVKYDPVFKDINWGQIGGVLEDQLDLIEYLSDNYTTINQLLLTKNELNNKINGVEAELQAVAESKQDKLDGLATFAKGKFLHTNSTSGELEWTDLITPILDNFYTKDESDAKFATITRLEEETTRATTAESKLQEDLETAVESFTQALTEEATTRSEADENLASRIDTKSHVVISENKGVGSDVAKSIEVDSVVWNLPTAEDKMDLLGSVPGHTDLPYNLSYFHYITPTEDKITVTAKTISLDNKKTQGEYSLDVMGATNTTAGLMTAADKVKLGDAQSKVKYSATEPEGSKDGDIWMF